MINYVLDLGYQGRHQVSSLKDAKRLIRERTAFSRSSAFDLSNWPVTTEAALRNATNNGHEVNFYTSSSPNAKYIGSIKRRIR